MKKIFLLMMLVVATISFIFAQESSSSLLKARDKEIKKIEKQNLPPEEISTQKRDVNSFYQPLIDSAMARESQGKNYPNTNQQNQRNLGGNVNLPNFQGGSYDLQKSANSYATVTVAEATAYSIKTYADVYKNSTTENNPNVNTTLKCLLRNEDYRNVVFTIKGVGGVLIITPTVPARGELEVDLPPGIYTITTNILAVNKTESKAVTREVGNPAKYSFWAGKKYWFVLTQPMDN
jgi:hypothetical protein